MKNSILKTFAMFCLIAAISITTVSAQAPTHIQVDIPFDFVAGEKELPAGQYTIKNASRNLETVLLIQSADKSRAAMILTNSVTGKSMQKTGKLVFHRYGDKHFLSQVWSPGLYVGRTVPESDGERNLDREMARTVRTLETAKKN